MTAIEACPLQWALSKAHYAGTWSSSGYPDRVYLGTLVGQVVHGVLECIVAQIAQMGGAVGDPSVAVQALRRLGGISALLEKQLERIAERASLNPRVAASGRNVREELQQRLPAMRMDVQLLLSRLRGNTSRTGHRDSEPYIVGTQSATTTRSVESGANVEVPLRGRGGLWKGVADLIVVDEGGVEILDYKTGARKPAHALQVQLYSRLFEEDEGANPRRYAVRALRLIYRDGEVAVPVPSGEERTALAAELDRRAMGAQEQVTSAPPSARPSAESCVFCNVKQLCNAYWTSAVIGEVAAFGAGALVDVELRVHERRAEALWSATVLQAAGRLLGAKVFVRCGQEHSHLFKQLAHASRVRILGASWLESGDDAEPAMLGLTRVSEVFIVE